MNNYCGTKTTKSSDSFLYEKDGLTLNSMLREDEMWDKNSVRN